MVTNNAVFIYRKAILYLIFMAYLSISQAQKLPTVQINDVEYVNTHPLVLAASHLLALKEGVLVVRLRSNRNKLRALEGMVDNAQSGSKDKLRLENLLDGVKKEQEIYEKGMIDALNLFYDFSGYVFMYDYDARIFKENRAPLFDANHNEVLMDSIIEKGMYILSLGDSEYNQSEVLEILDRNSEKISSPFPGKVSTGGFQHIMASFGKIGFHANRVRALNRKLIKSYETLVPRKDLYMDEKYLVPLKDYKGN